MDNHHHVLIIGLVWPEPASSAAGIRLLQLIKCFKEYSWRVSFASAAQQSEHSANLSQLDVECNPIDLNSSSFDTFLQSSNPTIVLFDRFVTEEQFGWRVAEACPTALRVLDTEDLHCLRLARQKAVKLGLQFSNDYLLNEAVAKREIASILRCDLSLIISEFEISLLIDFFRIDVTLLHYIPLFVESPGVEMATFEERSDFIFIGNYLHEPNSDAAQYLKLVLWDQMRNKLPHAKLLLYGAYTSQMVLQFHNEKKGFIVKGRAEDAADVISRAKVVLAPLRFGAGLKGKLFEAMQNGTPSVTTNIGAEGMAGDFPWCGFIADDPIDYVTRAVELYSNKIIWLEAQQRGFQIMEQRFQQEHFQHSFLEKLLTLHNNIDAHRTKNFLGRMLMHHTLASTKYMSMWIESKNKKKPD
ncbi:MAG TPA: glycosyltransferase [Flavobacterium sp.]|jgi:glycosyltransferase involved in cell wall biosynthesis